MTQKHPAAVQRAIRLISSPRFFWAIVVFVALEAGWIACTGRYPMAFDEDFHLGIIRLYAHHISPFWAHQPPHADTFGAVARDPSYLYHYLMSFPYRLISALTSSQPIQVLWLRAINIALFVSCLPLYRRLLLKTGASQALVNACFAVFALIPIVPLMAAQINYDNLLLPVTALTLLAVTAVSQKLTKRQLDIVLLLRLLVLCLLGSLVKYAFLPIVLAIALFTIVRLGQTFPKPQQLWQASHKAWRSFSLRRHWWLLVLTVLSLGLFGERYGLNVVRYHNPVPDCSQVLTVKQCKAYGPWIRDYDFKINKPDSDSPKGPLTYTADWFYGMWLRTFFAVDGPGTQFQTRGPFIVPAISTIIFGVAAAGVFVLTARRLTQRYRGDVLWLFTAVAGCYGGLLWLDDYRAYVHTGQPVAINGRYLLPVSLLLFCLAGLAFNELLRRWQAAKLGLAAVVLACLLCGGGALTYILRSNDAWYWHAQPVYDANHAVQRVLGPIIPGNSQPTQFLH